MKKLVIGCDHAAPELKAIVRDHLIERGFDVTDVGTHTTDSCNYPDYAHALCKKIQSGECELGFYHIPKMKSMEPRRNNCKITVNRYI